MNTDPAWQAEEWVQGRISEIIPDALLELPWPEHQRLGSAKLVEPLYHGDGSAGLGGLYAAVNAIRLVIAQRRLLSEREADDLFEAGLIFLECHRSLAACWSRGIRFQLWSRMVAALSRIAEKRFDLPVVVEQPFRGARTVTRDQTFRILEALVVRQRPSVIMRRGGTFAVITGYTPHSLLLSDSHGARSIRREACGVAMNPNRARHRLCPWSITTFWSV